VGSLSKILNYRSNYAILYPKKIIGGKMSNKNNFITGITDLLVLGIL